MLTTHFLNNGDIQTAYYDIGDPDKPPLLLLHGYTGSKLDFLNQSAWLVEGYRVLIPDQRGHGESSNVGPYTFAQLRDDLLQFMDQLGLATCHLLGHSMGGMIALRAVLDAPERFRSLILMDTAPYALQLLPDKHRDMIYKRVNEQGCQALLPGMRGPRPSAAVQRGINFLGEAEHWRRLEVKLTQMDPAAFTQLGDALGQQASVLERLSELSLATTILVGSQDTPFLKPSQDMHAHIADSTLVTITDAAHSPQYEHADAWRDAVLNHLYQASRST